MDTTLFFLLITLLFIASYTDLRAYRIPNLLTFPGMLAALTYHTSTSGWNGFFFSVTGLIVGTALLIIPYLMGGMGAGDAKLMGMVGAFLGTEKVFMAFLFSALAGGLYSIVMLIVFRRQYQGRAANLWHSFLCLILTRKLDPVSNEGDQAGPKLCYGLAISMGTAFYLVWIMSGHTIIGI
jgi:prepilin peptidase CpaA